MMKNDEPFVDLYEVLQVSPNAQADTIEKVYRIMAKRYHPDNQESGDIEKFNEIRNAWETMADPDKRAAYDVKYEEARTQRREIVKQVAASNGFDADKRLFEQILSILYMARRRDVDHPGMGIIQLENMLGCPEEFLEFHVWYLREKGWVERLQNGQLAITVDGVDKTVGMEPYLQKSRLLSERSDSSNAGD